MFWKKQFLKYTGMMLRYVALSIFNFKFKQKLREIYQFESLNGRVSGNQMAIEK